MPASGVEPLFWQRKSLAQMNRKEWELLCDGCGKCCLVKLEDEDDGEVYYTDVACNQLDLHSCQCKDYDNRKTLVPECLCLGPQDVKEFHWLPASCSYRLLYEGKQLPPWHPLLSADTEAIHRAGASVRGKVVSESMVAPQELEERLIYWVDDKPEVP